MDNLVRELNKLGYQPVFLPRTDIDPPELYNYSEESRRLVRRGPLKDYLAAAGGIEIGTGKLGDISYNYTSSKNIGAATSFLEKSLKCIGIDAIPKIDLGFTGSRDFSFAFTDVTYRKVDPSKIDGIIQGLSTGAIPEAVVEGGLLHIAYEYAYASELIMSRGDKEEFSENISGKIGDFIDLGVKGSASMASKTTISFKGAAQERAAFAYKAGYLFRESGHWEFYPEEAHRGAVTFEAPQFYVPQRGVVLLAEEAGTT
jgi:hypothetical protein